MDKYESLKLENQLCFPLYAAARSIMKEYNAPLGALDLTYTQYIVMLVLWEHERITSKQLCTLLYLDSGTLTPVLKALEKKGLLKKARSKEDERLLICTLTDAGRALKEKALAVPPAVGQCVNLSAEEARTLYKLLYKIL
ncbi:MAG: MarR family transcriptional regulator [Clostridia bacterium]|nr:MarR family transcriptional regulator [Clostridia bacterium]